MDIVKYFITSNAAAVELENEHLRNFMNRYNVKLPNRKSFTNELIPSLVKNLKVKIELKLQESFSITLIVDIWSSHQMADFIGLCTCIINNFKKKLLALDFTKELRNKIIEKI